MIHRDDGTGRYLIELSDLDPSTFPAELRRYEPAVRTSVTWAVDYLTRPHELLGRKGPVCPFVPGAIERSTFYLTIFAGRPADVRSVVDFMTYHRDWFLDLGGAGEADQYRTILVLFPDLPPAEVSKTIDVAHAALKTGYVTRGLMLGEFYDDPPPDSGGLWNADFRPLRSPVPLLGTRHMVPSDLPFLRGDRATLREYLRRFGDRIPARFASMAQEYAAKAGLDLEAFRTGSPTGTEASCR